MVSISGRHLFYSIPKNVRICFTLSSRLTLLVSMDKAGCSGTSKGALIPVKFLISPRRALAYRPFTSRASHTSFGNFGNTADVLSAVFSRKSKAFVDAAAYVVAIEDTAKQASLLQFALQSYCHGAFA